MSTMTEGLPLAQGTEVLARATRRRFTAAEKLRVLQEADRCMRTGELGALLRREGLYSSHLADWRRARDPFPIPWSTDDLVLRWFSGSSEPHGGAPDEDQQVHVGGDRPRPAAS